MVLASPMLLPLSRRRRSPKEKWLPDRERAGKPVVYLDRTAYLQQPSPQQALTVCGRLGAARFRLRARRGREAAGRIAAHLDAAQDALPQHPSSAQQARHSGTTPMPRSGALRPESCCTSRDCLSGMPGLLR